MNKKKKGFTLIELLATIIILSVLALIVVPQILNIMAKAKKQAFKDSVLSAATMIEEYMVRNKMESFDQLDINELSVDLNGKNWHGTFIENENGVYIANYISDGVFCAYGSIDDLIISDDCSSLDVTAPIIDKSKIALTTGSNYVEVNIKSLAIIDNESGIKNISITVYKNNNILDTKNHNNSNNEISDLFNNLSTGKYVVSIIATNNNNMTSKYDIDVVISELPKPTCTITPNGYATKKTVTGSYPSGYTNQYSVDGGETFIEYTEAIDFTSNGTFIARTTDGTNYVDSTVCNVTGIDTTEPTRATFTLTVTSNSIRVTASGTDNESGITHYQFSKDGGSTWLPSTPQTSSTYTFNGLTSGSSYNIKVRVYNGTYENGGRLYKDSEIKSVSTTTITKPTCTITPNGYATKKTVTGSYPSGYTNQYSVDGGETFIEYTEAIDFTSNGTFIARTTDGTNYVDSTVCNVTGIDTTEPTRATFTLTVTSNSIRVTASGTDNESGITHYQFSKDGGSTWLPSTPQTSSTYTFNGLTSGSSYNIKVRVYNGTYENGGRLSKDSSIGKVSTTTTTTTTTTTGTCVNDALKSISCNDCYDFGQSKGNEVYQSCNSNGGSNCSNAASSAAASARNACESCCY